MQCRSGIMRWVAGTKPLQVHYVKRLETLMKLALIRTNSRNNLIQERCLFDRHICTAGCLAALALWKSPVDYETVVKAGAPPVEVEPLLD